MQQERQFKYSLSDESKILINETYYHRPQGIGCSNDSSFTFGNKKACTNYGRNRHTIDTCYKTRGFPLHYGKNPVVANQSCVELNEERGGANDSKSCRGNDNYGFTWDQYNELVHLLHASNSTHNASTSKENHVSHNNNHITYGISRISHSFDHSNHGSWIVESGASDHICSSMRFFDDYKTTLSVNIRLPNRQMVVAKHAWTLKFSSKLIA